MTTRWMDLRYPLMAGAAFLGLYALLHLPQLLAAALVALLILLLKGGWRLYSDGFHRATNAGGFPSLADVERRNDHDFEILTMEQDLLTRLNCLRDSRGVAELGLNSDLLYLSRRHSLRMIKLIFFGTKDPEEGEICQTVLRQRSSDCVGVQVVRVGDRHQDPVGYCIGRWMRRRKSRRIVLMPGFSQSAVGIIRNERDRSLYFTCLLESPVGLG